MYQNNQFDQKIIDQNPSQNYTQQIILNNPLGYNQQNPPDQQYIVQGLTIQQIVPPPQHLINGQLYNYPSGQQVYAGNLNNYPQMLTQYMSPGQTMTNQAAFPNQSSYAAQATNLSVAVYPNQNHTQQVRHFVQVNVSDRDFFHALIVFVLNFFFFFYGFYYYCAVFGYLINKNKVALIGSIPTFFYVIIIIISISIGDEQSTTTIDQKCETYYEKTHYPCCNPKYNTYCFY